MEKERLRLTLKGARANKNLKQADVAKLLGITKKTLSNWEQGKSFPRKPEYIDALCNLYGVSYDDIIFLNNDNA